MSKTIIAIGITVLLGGLAHAESITISNLSNKPNRAVNHAREILLKVKDFSGLKEDVGNLTIVVFQTRGDLEIEYMRLQHDHGGFVAFYEPSTNTIYTYPGVTAYVLAHELTHVLVYHYKGERLLKEIEDLILSKDKEKLPHYVEQNIKLGWL